MEDANVSSSSSSSFPLLLSSCMGALQSLFLTSFMLYTDCECAGLTHASHVSGLFLFLKKKKKKKNETANERIYHITESCFQSSSFMLNFDSLRTTGQSDNNILFSFLTQLNATASLSQCMVTS